MTGLEALNKIQHDFGQLKGQELVNCYEIIEKSLKALEIIKEKLVDVFRFKKLDFDTFNQLQKSCKLPELTQEEFNLLKEVLE